MVVYNLYDIHYDLDKLYQLNQRRIGLKWHKWLEFQGRRMFIIVFWQQLSSLQSQWSALKQIVKFIPDFIQLTLRTNSSISINIKMGTNFYRESVISASKPSKNTTKWGRKFYQIIFKFQFRFIHSIIDTLAAIIYFGGPSLRKLVL